MVSLRLLSKLGGGTPSRPESILEKLDFQKGALFKKYIYPTHIPPTTKQPGNGRGTIISLTHKKLEIQKNKTKKLQ